jgi:tetratricopeptide (TPR) repeat protein
MRVTVAMMCALLAAGCAAEQAETAGPSGRLPAAMAAGVPFHPQKGFRCGPAAMAAMLEWTGIAVTPADLEGRFYGEAPDPRARLEETARTYGRLAYPVSGTEQMLNELAAGHPVLMLENLGVASQPLWNCAVAVGYRDNGATLLINGGAQPARPRPRRTVERLWAETEEWGMVVLRPGDLPATATAAGMVNAARDLAQAGRTWEAVLTYDATLSQWPRDAEALMGLGAGLYALGDVRGAADAYRLAASVAKDPAPALDALGHVLASIGHPSLAATPRKAFEISDRQEEN